MSFIDFSRLFQVKYLLTSLTDYNFKFLIPTLIIFSAIIILSLVGWFILKKRERVYQNLALQILTFGLTIGLIGLALVFFRYESLPYLSMRAWMVILTLVFIVWGARIAIWSVTYLPKSLDYYNKRKDFEKYLPRAKNQKNKNIN